MVNILICDDHAVVRRGLRDILSEEFPTAEFGEAKSGNEAIEAIGNNKWDLVILDIMMPDRDGLDVLAQAKERWPDLSILVLSTHSEEQFAIRVMRMGASGYMNKETAPDELRNAVKTMLSGKRYISPTLAERLAMSKTDISGRQGHELLSEREFIVMQRISKGKSIKEIAGELNVSAKTITTYRSRALKKLHLKSNAEMVQYALRNGLVT